MVCGPELLIFTEASQLYTGKPERVLHYRECLVLKFHVYYLAKKYLMGGFIYNDMARMSLQHIPKAYICMSSNF